VLFLIMIRRKKGPFNRYFLARKMSSVIWRSPLATRCIADACHMDKNGVGYNCIALIITRRLGNGKIFIPAFCLTVLDESTEAWTNFFRFCISLGMDLTNPDSVLVSDMAKGLKSACMALGIQSRECLTHIFHRLQDELDCFSKGQGSRSRVKVKGQGQG
jgi:hypothetical protein